MDKGVKGGKKVPRPHAGQQTDGLFAVHHSAVDWNM